jgi:hypothetical protein
MERHRAEASGPGGRGHRVTRVHVPGAPRTPRDRIDRAARVLRRREHGLRASLARFVARQPDRRLELLLGPIVVWALPLFLWATFRPDYAVDFDLTDIDALILVQLLRDRGCRCDRFDVAIERRRCRVRRHRAGARRPDASLTVRLTDLLRVLAGATDPLALASAERVVMTGDTFLLVRFPAMFRQPTRSVI